MKKVLSFFAAVLTLILLAGCGTYSSKYRAVGLVHSNESASAYMGFYTFDGRMVFRLKSTGEGSLHYSADLESGSAAVYYDSYGTKSELFSVNGGEVLDSFGGYVEAGTVYIIVETSGECRNGHFRFCLE